MEAETMDAKTQQHATYATSDLFTLHDIWGGICFIQMGGEIIFIHNRPVWSCPFFTSMKHLLMHVAPSERWAEKNHFWALLPKEWLMSRGSAPSNGCHLTRHPFCSADCCIVEPSARQQAWVSDVSVRSRCRRAQIPLAGGPLQCSPCNCHLGDLKSLPDRSH